ncbi:hypothetical protein BJV74DRAFT_886649 [Russula compacta]|nr:hypothetical protein BJV74DRAFT_886649 [Russula compacta]
MPSTPPSHIPPPVAPSPPPPPPPPPPAAAAAAAAAGIPSIFQQHQQVTCHSEYALHALDPPSLWRTPAAAAATSASSSSSTITFNGTTYSNLPADITARVAALPPLLRSLQQPRPHPFPTSFTNLAAAHTTLPPLPPPPAFGSASLALGSMSSSSAFPPAPPPQVITPVQLQLANAALPSLPNFRQPIVAAASAPAPVPAPVPIQIIHVVPRPVVPPPLPPPAPPTSALAPAPPLPFPPPLPIACHPFDPDWHVHNLGNMDVQCPFCHALHWMPERLTNSSARHPKFGKCSLSGKVTLHDLLHPPHELFELLTS